ncbi:MAG: hemolysin III family protein [Planctomycetes bacterium]|nr:hemolysin III family protein [Planctomycetota bacterium]
MSKNKERDQHLGEEIANSISHGLGAVAAVIATPFLIFAAVEQGDAKYIVGASIFAASMILLYLTSTLYHAFPHGKTKRIFRVIEHSMIFVLIAGTYSPFTLGILTGGWGWTIFGIVWGLTVVGVLMKIFDQVDRPWISTGLYLLMGWVIVIAAGPLISSMPLPGLIWLAAGGLAYTLGVIFYAADSKFRFGHFVWHLFVLLGTTCHFFAVYFYGAPGAGA